MKSIITILLLLFFSKSFSQSTGGYVLKNADGTIPCGTIINSTWNGNPIGVSYGGVPSGGTTNQVLAKSSNSDYALQWVTSSGSGTVTDFVFTNANGFTGSVSTSTTTPTLSLTLQNAAADGTTKGQASFVANDFDASSENIGIDYTNGQAASGSAKGFLASADWTTFNNKLGSGDIGVSVQAFDSDLETWRTVTPGSNVTTWIATPSSSNLASALTDEVGSLGGFVRASGSKLGSDYTNNSTTGTEITGLEIASTGTGVVSFEFYLLVQSSATGTGWKFGINHTGTATVLALNMTYPSTGGAAATGVGEDVVANNTGAIYEAAASTSFTTTAPNLGPTAGVAATGTNVLVRVFGLLNVTATGNLEIWCGAETTGTITVKANSIGYARAL